MIYCQDTILPKVSKSISCKIHSLHFIKFDLTTFSQQAWLAQWERAGLVSKRSQVQILLMTIFLYFFLEVTLVIHIYSTLVNYTDIQKGLRQFLALFKLYNPVSSFSLHDELFFILVVMYSVKTSDFFSFMRALWNLLNLSRSC